MYLKLLNIDEISEIYNTHMVKDFPKAELKPLDHIVNYMKNDICISVGMYESPENNNETSFTPDLLAGYATFIIPKDYNYCLLDYFAITAPNRGKGFGHTFFSLMKDFFADKLPSLQGIFLECESVESASDEKEISIRTRRIAFYKDCGCIMTNLGSNVFGVEYSILMLPVNNLKNNEFIRLSRNDVDIIYKTMFKPHHYKEYVSLWEKLDEETLSMSAKKLAPFLIGKLLCRNIDGNIIKYRITETECYCGEEDTACHAHKGKTERTKTLYEKGGTSYVYLCYGIHCLFNVVSGEYGHPEAVLIRGVEGFDGPGKLTKAMKIDRSLNGIDMTCSDMLWIEDDGFKCRYRRDKRVGIDYATPKYRDILWRYIMV